MQTTIHEQIFNCKSREEKKELLKSLSKGAKQIVATTEEGTVNSVLIEMYKNNEHQEFNSFKRWLQLGYKVKKGAKAFFVWSKPKKAKDKTSENEEDEFSFYAIAYIFSNAQVEPLKEKVNA